MGNEVSRADGLSPQAGAADSARGGSSSKLPTTPMSTPTARRAKSFSSFQSPPLPSASNNHANGGGGTTTPRASAAAALQKQQSIPANVERTIQRMDKAIRKRVRGGITYNMKIIIRGERGTGKTSLFHRLKGEPIPSEHASTPQLQTATINWNFRTNSEENVKCEVWDVVDRGFDPLAPAAAGDAGGSGVSSSTTTGAGPTASPFELGTLQSNSNFASVRASAAVAASIAGASGATGSHTVATVDASTVDVYHETHGAIFLLDITKWHTLEYVRQQLERVPVHIPTLVLGNFRDCGNQRQIFKEDIQELLYGSSDRAARAPLRRRPHELLYFECSLLNCYGLKSLHQYFGVPFLQLKLATIRQQLRIVEGDFAHLKHDLTAKIAEQRYADYVDHIKATGSDIRTGRKVRTSAAAASTSVAESTIVVNGRSGREAHDGDGDGDDDNDERDVSTVRTHSNSSSSDIGVVTQPAASAAAEASAPSPMADTHADASPRVASESTPHTTTEVVQKDLEDLPTRTHSLADQRTAALKFEHSESGSSSLRDEPLATPSPVASVPDSNLSEKPQGRRSSSAPAPAHDAAAAATNGKRQVSASRSSSAAAAADEPMNLEDFQVPKTKNNDLESFYSDADDSDGASDDDVIVPPSAVLLLAKKTNHKQQFLYSDSDDSDDAASARRKPKKSSPRRGRGVAATAAKRSVAATAAPQVPVSDVPTPPDATLSQVTGPERPQQPPMSSPATTRPVSPALRTSRSPSPRQKLESSRSQSPSARSPSAAACADAASVEVSDAQTTPVDARTSVTHAAPESPSSHASPRRRLQAIKTPPSPVKSSADEPVASDGETVGVTLEVEAPPADSMDTTASQVVTAVVSESPVDDEHVVVPGGIDAFFSDDDDDGDDSAGVSAVPPASSEVQTPRGVAPVVPELLVSDDDDGDDVPEPFAAELRVAGGTADSARLTSESHSVTSVDTRIAESDSDSDTLTANGAPFVLVSSAGVAVAESLTARSTPEPSDHVAAVLLSDGGDDDNAPAHSASVPQPAMSSSPATARPLPALPTNELDSFFSESDSDDGGAVLQKQMPIPPARAQASRGPMRHTIAASDDDDTDDAHGADRFASYDARVTRKSKAERRQERDEIRRMTASLRSTRFPVDEPSATATTLGMSVSADVLAAIRAAQEEALRMLPPSDGVGGAVAERRESAAGGSSERTKSRERKNEKKKSSSSSSSSKTKAKKSSKSSSSSRRRHEVIDSDE